MEVLLTPDPWLAVAGAVAIWLATRSHHQVKATCIMGLGFIGYCYVPAIILRQESGEEGPLGLTRLAFGALIVAVAAASLAMPYPRRAAPAQDDPRSRRSHADFLAGGAVVAAIAFAVYLTKVPQLPALSDTAEHAAAREIATTKLPWFGTISLVFYYLMPLVWAGLLVTGRTVSGIAVFALALLAVLATGQKAPFVYQLFMMSVLIASGRRRFPYMAAIAVAIAAASILAALVLVQNFGYQAPTEESVAISLDALVQRAVLTPARVMEGWCGFFPLAHPFIGTEATSRPIDRMVYDWMNPGSPYDGTANGPFFLMSYARFGDDMPVFVASVFAVFLALALIDGMILRSRKVSATAACYPLVCLGGLLVNATDLATALRPIVLVLMAHLGVIFAIEIFRGSAIDLRARIASARSTTFVLACLLALAYLLQGQLRAIILGGGT